MKIIIYGICKNEEAFVDRFMDASAGADAVYLLDTGSTDSTVEKLKARGANVSTLILDTFRFDHARNAALRQVPEDVDLCISLDMDEVLCPDWRAALEAAWKPEYTRGRFAFHFTHDPAGQPVLTFLAERIHTRKGHTWKYPCHEVLVEHGITRVDGHIPGFTVGHWPDQTKSRGSYLPLLQLGAREEPGDDRCALYLGREYLFKHHRNEAATELMRYLALPSAISIVERSSAMRMLASCAATREAQEQWLLRATATCPQSRDGWVELANWYNDAPGSPDWLGVYYAARRAIAISVPVDSVYMNPAAWGPLPWLHASAAAWRIGGKDESRRFAQEALKRDDGTHPSVVTNVAWIEERLCSTCKGAGTVA